MASCQAERDRHSARTLACSGRPVQTTGLPQGRDSVPFVLFLDWQAHLLLKNPVQILVVLHAPTAAAVSGSMRPAGSLQLCKAHLRKRRAQTLSGILPPVGVLRARFCGSKLELRKYMQRTCFSQRAGIHDAKH